MSLIVSFVVFLQHKPTEDCKFSQLHTLIGTFSKCCFKQLLWQHTGSVCSTIGTGTLLTYHYNKDKKTWAAAADVFIYVRLSIYKIWFSWNKILFWQ